jgi:hypothetical protein
MTDTRALTRDISDRSSKQSTTNDPDLAEALRRVRRIVDRTETTPSTAVLRRIVAAFIAAAESSYQHSEAERVALLSLFNTVETGWPRVELAE